MTSLETVLTSECVGMTNTEALTHVKTKTITIAGLAPSGYVLSYLASIGKLSTLRTIAAGEASPLKDPADAAIVTLETRDGFDFSVPATDGLMSAFVSASVLTQVQADTIKAMGEKVSPMFSGVRMVDIVNIREAE